MTTYKTQLTGTTAFTNYKFRVKGTNQQGSGEWSAEVGSLGPEPDIQFNFNKVEGGSVSVKQNWNSTGEEWTIHQFTSAQKLTVVSAVNPFNLVLVGGGGGANGGPDCCTCQAWGGKGGVSINPEVTLAIGEYDVTMTAAGGGGWPSPGSGSTVRLVKNGSTLYQGSGRGGGSVGGLEGPGGNTNIMGNGNQSVATGGGHSSGGGGGCGYEPKGRRSSLGWGDGTAGPASYSGGAPPGGGGASRLVIAYRTG